MPEADPLATLPAAFAAWDELGRELPKLVAARRVRDALARLPVLDPSGLSGELELRRAMLLLGAFASTSVWERDPPAAALPPCVAIPLHAVATRLGTPPMLSYSLFGLHNWRRIDPDGPIALGNLAVLQNMTGGLDEDWFVLVHVDIEARAQGVPEAAVACKEAALRGELDVIAAGLSAIADAEDRMIASVGRMQERCDPYIFFNRVQPFMMGFRQHPVVYEGVEALRGEPQMFVGASGAQSPLLPLLDAALGVGHAGDGLTKYLLELRGYMAPRHARFVEAIEAGPSLRELVLDRKHDHPPLAEQYERALDGLERFRSVHIELAATYITKQARLGASGRGELGTGGSPFVPYLKKHRDETIALRLRGPEPTSSG